MNYYLINYYFKTEILQRREESWQFKKVNFWVVTWSILTWSKVLISPFYKRYIH